MGEGILLKPKTTTVDLAKSGASHATPKEMKNLLNRLREEDTQGSLCFHSLTEKEKEYDFLLLDLVNLLLELLEALL